MSSPIASISIKSASILSQFIKLTTLVQVIITPHLSYWENLPVACNDSFSRQIVCLPYPMPWTRTCKNNVTRIILLSDSCSSGPRRITIQYGFNNNRANKTLIVTEVKHGERSSVYPLHAKGNFKNYFPLFFKKAFTFYYELGPVVGPDGIMKNKTFSSWILWTGEESH